MRKHNTKESRQGFSFGKIKFNSRMAKILRKIYTLHES